MLVVFDPILFLKFSEKIKQPVKFQSGIFWVPKLKRNTRLKILVVLSCFGKKPTTKVEGTSLYFFWKRKNLLQMHLLIVMQD